MSLSVWICHVRPWRTGPPAGQSRFASRGLASVRVQQHGEPGDGLLIILTTAANVAYPGGEIRHGDQLVAEPGEVGDELQVHHPRLALCAGERLGGLWVRGYVGHNDYWRAA